MRSPTTAVTLVGVLLPTVVAGVAGVLAALRTRRAPVPVPVRVDPRRSRR